jgi:omega-6 fatty acid desaturase (delta-12 desaturase)
MMQDQVFVPKTRSQLGLPPLDPAKEDPVGRSVTNDVKEELWEALGDSPIGATLLSMGYLVGLSSAEYYYFGLIGYPDHWMAFVYD